MAEIVLRDAQLQDAAEIAAVHIASWRAAYRGMLSDALLDGLSLTERTEQWRDTRLAESQTIVALRAGAIVGFCELLRRDPPYIRALYLEPDVLRGGIGTLLLDATLRRLRDDGEREVTLDVLSANARARAFYERHGFTELAESESFHGAPQLLMRRALASS